MNRAFWHGKRVFLTGHTGFKGGWLALWLSDMGAKVYGFSLPPPTDPNLFTVCGLQERMAGHVIGDVRDGMVLTQAIQAVEPEIVFHLAAQPLVRHSYASPVETYTVNILGTVNLLEAVRHTPGISAVINVTSDKCYENQEWIWPYRETEPIGGYDPYSSSKGCSELVTAAYRRSFLAEAGISVASARAGNVIGGGDWAEDRLIPDFLRALDAKSPMIIRSPNATRPWQHVLEPLSGYLALAEKLYIEGQDFAEAWNFGPDDADTRSVRWIMDYLRDQIPSATWKEAESVKAHEAMSLKLDSSKAKKRLGWHPRWHLVTALDKTLAWHHSWRQGAAMNEIGIAQIHEYEAISP